MIKAEDTVMTHKEKQFFIVERSHQQTIGELQEDFLLLKQAQISFSKGKQAGIQEVVDWISGNGLLPGHEGIVYGYNTDNPSYEYDSACKHCQWQAKLKEWGINYD